MGWLMRLLVRPLGRYPARQEQDSGEWRVDVGSWWTLPWQ
jgi:hypothetical protein